MQVLASQPNDNDKIFPGDNWFFYWKTSSALWKEKLQNFESSRIVIPINWAFHSENGERFDFHQDKPETNLKKLETLAKEVGKELIFFVPISPAPFLTGGGLPHVLSRVPSISREGFQVVVSDANSKLNKIYSFYDQRVFLAFRKFLKALGKYFSDNEMFSNLWAIECGLVQDEQFISFLEDYSKAFNDAFERFLKVKKAESDDENKVPMISSESQEEALRFEFITNIRALYLETIKEFFPVNYEGEVKIAFLGGAMDDLLNKLVDAEGQNKYSKDIMTCLTMNIIPSSILLSPLIRQGVIEKQFDDLVGTSFMSTILGDNLYDVSEDRVFLPLTNFNLYHQDLATFSKTTYWQTLGLNSFLKNQYNWAYKINSLHSPLKVTDESNFTSQIHFFVGADITKKEYFYILKIFMNGGKVIIESSSLSEEFSKKFEAFFLENSIELEMLNVVTRLNVGTLGEGQIVFLDGGNISSLTEDKKHDFWRDVISIFELINVNVLSENGIDYIWRTRSPATSELNFEEVRRVYFYNPTSYKKKVRMNWEKNFALLKINDEINSKVQHESNQSVIELLPMGSVSMDFGVFH